MQERRRARRYQVDWPMKVVGVGRFRPQLDEVGVLKNLSSRGALGNLTSYPPVGTRLVVSIRLPTEPDRWISYRAEVTRIDGISSGGGVALKFTHARPRFVSDN